MATNYVKRQANQPHAYYTAVYSDGKRVVVGYASTENGWYLDRWGEIDVSAKQWAPLKPYTDGVGAAKVYEFKANLRAGDIAGLQKIWPCGVLFDGEDIYSTLGICRVNPREMYSGEQHRKGIGHSPLTAYITGNGRLTLIRDDPDHSGELQQLSLMQDNIPHPEGWLAAYPFAVAVDIVTSPLQALGLVVIVLFFRA